MNVARVVLVCLQGVLHADPGIPVPEEVELLSDNREPSCLRKVEGVGTDKVACVQQVLHLKMHNRPCQLIATISQQHA